MVWQCEKHEVSETKYVGGGVNKLAVLAEGSLTRLSANTESTIAIEDSPIFTHKTVILIQQSWIIIVLLLSDLCACKKQQYMYMYRHHSLVRCLHSTDYPGEPISYEIRSLRYTRATVYPTPPRRFFLPTKFPGTTVPCNLKHMPAYAGICA